MAAVKRCFFLTPFSQVWVSSQYFLPLFSPPRGRSFRFSGLVGTRWLLSYHMLSPLCVPLHSEVEIDGWGTLHHFSWNFCFLQFLSDIFWNYISWPDWVLMAKVSEMRIVWLLHVLCIFRCSVTIPCKDVPIDLWLDSLCQRFARWWVQIFFIFTPIWGRFPIWLICFKGVETTN